MNNISLLQLRLRAQKVYCDLILAPVSKEDKTVINKHWLRIVGTDSIQSIKNHLKGLTVIHDNYYKPQIKDEL